MFKWNLKVLAEASKEVTEKEKRKSGPFENEHEPSAQSYMQCSNTQLWRYRAHYDFQRYMAQPQGTVRLSSKTVTCLFRRPHNYLLK